MTRSGPRVGGMARLALLLSVAVALVACSPSVRAGGDPPAEDVKAEVDGVAREVVPPLTEALGVQPTGLRATFVERGGFDLWDYGAGGQFVGPQRARGELLDAIGTVLSEAGLTIERDEARGEVRGTRGNVSVRLRVAPATVAGSSRTQHLVQVSIGSIAPTSEGGGYAEDASPEDYTAYAR